ncbi:MAG: T9SS type A sorting domain-containing protein [Bacteroidaceae bacterium]|nr:T9SS type A sorting domain-containing protein [Bacteroidaceae bacterium]
MKKQLFLTVGMATLALGISAQEYKEGYIDWGYGGPDFGAVVEGWEKGKSVSEDDNFFISRVKPRERFRNVATQVNQEWDATNDKKLIAWVPFSTSGKNALPDGVFDSEVFNMWSYVTHWGDWNVPLGRVPAGLLDVAHKNGVAVSGVAGIPYGNMFSFPDWAECIEKMTDVGAQKVADFHRYYGVDGLGYNSEFSGGGYLVRALIPFHTELVQIARKDNPIFENFWYDGTNDNGVVTFDQGLGTHNDDIFGREDEHGASLFMNYNWNYPTRLSQCVDYAKSIGRSSLDLYAGVNMQGAEPQAGKYNSGDSWPLLKQYPISIGLWGAHNENMFWESRGELGSAPAVKQRTYQLRIERWFTGGKRNPANCPPLSNSMKYNAENYDFHGMSSLMSARSALKWNLAEEPFITYFNLGNGTYFNWKGVRQHSKEWYNIGVQDYMPTWRWWFATSLLGRTAADVATGGLDAEFSWDEAYVGGSSLRIFGATSSEYLHLFKTEYALQAGDVLTLRYKLKAGAADVSLVLTAKDAEAVAINEGAMSVLTTKDEADEDLWVERTFTVGSELAGKDLALIALHVENASNLDLYLGELSIVRGVAEKPAKPEITKTAILGYSKFGIDGKVIFNMKNDKPAGEPCYNIDVKTSLFKLYAQQEGQQPILMGITTSWAGMFYQVPMVLNGAERIRFGVSAVALDMKSESDIAWGDYMVAENYVYDDAIQISKTTIKPNESFAMSYVDPKHEDASWVLTDGEGNVVFESTGNAVDCEAGLPKMGIYDLTLTGVEHDAETGESVQTTRSFSSFVQITSESIGALPEIYTLTANGKEADIQVFTKNAVELAYTGRKADGAGSQGVDLVEQRFGVKCSSLGIEHPKSFSVAFWLKINKLAAGETQLLAIANKLDSWPKTDWGWIWSNVDETGQITSFTWRGTDATNNNELRYKYENTKLPVGNWVHLAYTFDYNEAGGFRGEFYVNGVKQEVTKWNRATDGESYKKTVPDYEPNVYTITDGQVLSVGGAAHGRNGIDGVIDNFQVWNKVMTAEDVALSMGDLVADALPENLLSFWDFEKKAGGNKTFISVGKKKVPAGAHTYTASGGEGQGTFKWIVPEYTSGCPFIAGTAYPVTTLPAWKAKKGVVTDAVGTDQEGTAKVTYAKGGDYEVVLTLANSLGSDQRTFRVISVVDDPSGISDATLGEVAAYAVDGAVIVELVSAGNYDICVYNAAGQKVAAKQQAFVAGQKAQISLAKPGVYVVSIAKDGKQLRSVKLINK